MADIFLSFKTSDTTRAGGGPAILARGHDHLAPRLAIARPRCHHARMNNHLTPDELRQLSVTDRLRLIEEIWDSFDAAEDAVDFPDWHKRVLDERLAAHEPLALT